MNWYLIKSTYNAKLVQMMFYGDVATAVTAFNLAAALSGGVQGFVWGSGTWQPWAPGTVPQVNY